MNQTQDINEKRNLLTRFLRQLELLVSRRRMDMLKEVESVIMVECLVPRQATIQLNFKNGQKFTLWTDSPIIERERYISIMQPIGSPTPRFKGGWPKEKTYTLEAKVNSISPY